VTLVLSVLTQREVVQVSDRRFTYSRPDGSVSSRNDEKNKAVLFCGRVVFAFTGRGDLGPKRSTDLWLAERICDVLSEESGGDQGVVLERLAGKATHLFERAYRGERHAFIGVGWARFGGSASVAPSDPDEFQPYLACLSNFHDHEGRELEQVQTSFSRFLRVLAPGEGGFLFDAPRHLDATERSALLARLAAADAARSVEGLVEALADQVHAVASRDPGVGHGLMINILPRRALGEPGGMTALASGPLADAQTFLYVPPSGDTTVQLGPVSTCGGTIMSGFRAEPLSSAPDASSSTPAAPGDPADLVRRWYLAPIVGTGTTDDPYRAETLGRGGSALIPSREDGRPRHPVALVLVASRDHSALEDDERLQPLADLTDLDAPTTALPESRRTWLVSAARGRGVSVEGRARDVLRRIGQQLDSDFDETGYGHG
jgi:hypothetical protein